MIFFPNDFIGSNNNIHQNLTNPPILAKELTTIQKLQAAWNKFTDSVKSFFNTIQTKINNTVTCYDINSIIFYRQILYIANLSPDIITRHHANRRAPPTEHL